MKKLKRMWSKECYFTQESYKQTAYLYIEMIPPEKNSADLKAQGRAKD